MPFVRVASLAALPPGSVLEALVGDGTYAICNTAGEIHALDGICPHSGGPLGHGALHGTTLVCPWHAWEYDCRSGANEADDGLRLDKFPVKIQGDDILIDVP
ncbi:MAG TPA: Rieske (2Fe-2S) protein [Bryobacteraceae bacterium]|jgi:nitrite reductase/ring-hydroxylating ferredoxin subunit